MVLAGFLPSVQFESFLEDARPKVDASAVEALRRQYGEAISFVKTFATEEVAKVDESPLSKQFAFRADEIQRSPEFSEVYGNRAVRFATIKPDRLAVFQFQVRVGGRTLSTDPSLVLDECLPRSFDLDVDLEIVGNPGGGAFQIAGTTESGNAHIGKLRIDHERHVVELPFIPNRNWVQVAHFEKRYWIFNGYHRIYNLMALKVDRIPCIVSEAQAPVEFLGNAFDPQSFEVLRRMPRPPLMKDYFSKAAIRIPRRHRKHRLVANVQLGSERIPV